MRRRLPGMWPVFGACVHAEKARQDNIVGLGGSILQRCARALEARDIIGAQYYCGPSYCDHDRMLYHFDYLTVLLVGALDALARVVHRTYSLTNPEEWQVSWRKRN